MGSAALDRCLCCLVFCRREGRLGVTNSFLRRSTALFKEQAYGASGTASGVVTLLLAAQALGKVLRSIRPDP